MGLLLQKPQQTANYCFQLGGPLALLTQPSTREYVINSSSLQPRPKLCVWSSIGSRCQNYCGLSLRKQGIIRQNEKQSEECLWSLVGGKALHLDEVWHLKASRSTTVLAFSKDMVISLEPSASFWWMVPVKIHDGVWKWMDTRKWVIRQHNHTQQMIDSVLSLQLPPWWMCETVLVQIQVKLRQRCTSRNWKFFHWSKLRLVKLQTFYFYSCTDQHEGDNDVCICMTQQQGIKSWWKCMLYLQHTYNCFVHHFSVLFFEGKKPTPETKMAKFRFYILSWWHPVGLMAGSLNCSCRSAVLQADSAQTSRECLWTAEMRTFSSSGCSGIH